MNYYDSAKAIESLDDSVQHYLDALSNARYETVNYTHIVYRGCYDRHGDAFQQRLDRHWKESGGGCYTLKR